MVDNNENTLGSGFITDNGQAGGSDLGSGFVTSSEPTNNIPPTGGNTLANTFTDIKELSVQGAMSTVYQGKKYGKWHIIKRIKPQFKDNPQYRELFMKEFDNGVQLDHPNIVRFEDKGEDADGLWYTMEYVDGRPLSDLIKTGELIKNERLTRSILTQLCDALSYVHKKQIVHRDLKPDNILVTYRGDNVKVLDFGLAYSDSYDDHLVKAGTPKYAAPEQMTKGNLVDQRADIYAVGMILLEMCTGSLVDKQASTVQNPNFQHIINRATQADPEQRYHDCREIMEDLNSTIVKETAPIPTPQAVAQPIAQPIETQVEGEHQKSKLPLILGIVAAAVVIGIAIFFLTRKGDTPNPPANNIADNTEQTNTTPDQNGGNSKTDNQQQDNQPSIDNDKTDNGYSEQEKMNDETNKEVKNLLAEANKVLDEDKNIVQALSLYDALLKHSKLDSETKKEVEEKIDFCNKQKSKYHLNKLHKELGGNELYGYRDDDGYIVIDFLYKDEKKHKTSNKLLAVSDATGKWGIISDATKLPVTKFKYSTDKMRNDYPDNYRMFLWGEQNKWDEISIVNGKVRIQEYPVGKR